MCTSVNEDADLPFINSLKDTFKYLGMKYGGYMHANCDNGFHRANYEKQVKNFVDLVTELSSSR